MTEFLSYNQIMNVWVVPEGRGTQRSMWIECDCIQTAAVGLSGYSKDIPPVLQNLDVQKHIKENIYINTRGYESTSDAEVMQIDFALFLLLLLIIMSTDYKTNWRQKSINSYVAMCTSIV